MKMKATLVMIILICIGVNSMKAQSFTPNVSQDSLRILKGRELALNANLKIYELKIKEAEEEADTEKLRVKLVAANAKAEESAIKNNKLSDKIGSGTLKAEAIEKAAKRAKNDMADSQKALNNYHKQIKRVETIRDEIRVEEAKLKTAKPLIVFDK